MAAQASKDWWAWRNGTLEKIAELVLSLARGEVELAAVEAVALDLVRASRAMLGGKTPEEIRRELLGKAKTPDEKEAVDELLGVGTVAAIHDFAAAIVKTARKELRRRGVKA